MSLFKKRKLDKDDDMSDLFEKMNIDEKQQWEVTSICNHRKNKNGSYSWNVRFSGFSQRPEWVHEDDTNCEKLIQQYLKEHAPYIRTVYGICRVSSKTQTGPTHVSLDAQEAKIRETINLLEIKDNEEIRIKIFKISASAYRGIPSVLKMIGEFAGKNDILMTYRIDRLSRNIFLILNFLENLKERGVLLYSLDENIWYHKRLEFIQYILDANKESLILSKRVKMSISYRRTRGDYIGSVPYGYRLQRDPKTNSVKKVKDYKEQSIINRIKTSKNTNDKLEKTFEKEGILKRHKKWTSSMINYIRKN
jgi:DNA invertase Pin-like site-specific DNA recombinase